MNGMERCGEVRRSTRETRIELALALDGRGEAAIETGIPFFDHLLEAWTRHGLFDLRLKAEGDLPVDGHHTVEDVGICLGKALHEALGDRSGIRRFGAALLPMDEALAEVALDLSNRPFLHWEVPVPARAFGPFHTELAPEFWRAFTTHGGVTLHVQLRRGENSHHILEAVWKGVGRALRDAIALDPRLDGPPSTKGSL